MHWRPSAPAGQTKECYIYRLSCTGSIDETILERQTQKGGLLEMVSAERPKLPPAHSPDRDLLFKLDDTSTSSRLAARLPADSPYADEAVWKRADLGGADGRDGRVRELPHACLRSLAQAFLRVPPHKLASGAVAAGSTLPLPDAVAAVTAQESSVHLVSFIWSHVEGKAPVAAAPTAAMAPAAALGVAPGSSSAAVLAPAPAAACVAGAADAASTAAAPAAAHAHVAAAALPAERRKRKRGEPLAGAPDAAPQVAPQVVPAAGPRGGGSDGNGGGGGSGGGSGGDWVDRSGRCGGVAVPAGFPAGLPPGRAGGILKELLVEARESEVRSMRARVGVGVGVEG